MRRIPHGRVVMITVGGSNIIGIVFPRSRANDTRQAIVFYPSRTVRRRALIVLVPAISHPLMDIAAHIIEAKWIWLEAADLQRLGRLVGFIAALTIGHRGLGLLAPPKLASSAPTGRILPFGFGRKPKRLLRDLGEPVHILLRISPAQICDRGIVVTRWFIATTLCRNACVPLADRDGKFAD